MRNFKTYNKVKTEIKNIKNNFLILRVLNNFGIVIKPCTSIDEYMAGK
jgi:hypothetical protein